MDGTGHEGTLRVLPPLGTREPGLVGFRAPEPDQAAHGEAQAARNEPREHLAVVISAASRLGPVPRDPSHDVTRDPVPPRAAAHRVDERRSVRAQPVQL